MKTKTIRGWILPEQDGLDFETTDICIEEQEMVRMLTLRIYPTRREAELDTVHQYSPKRIRIEVQK